MTCHCCVDLPSQEFKSRAIQNGLIVVWIPQELEYTSIVLYTHCIWEVDNQKPFLFKNKQVCRMVRIIFLMDFYTVAVFAEKLNLAKQMTEYLT